MFADKRETKRDKHLYVDANGKYPCKLNGWEKLGAYRRTRRERRGWVAA